MVGWLCEWYIRVMENVVVVIDDKNTNTPSKENTNHKQPSFIDRFIKEDKKRIGRAVRPQLVPKTKPRQQNFVIKQPYVGKK